MSAHLREREAVEQRRRLAVFGGIVLWQVVGAAAGAISYASEAGGFELEMRRAALRSELLAPLNRRRSVASTAPDTCCDTSLG